MRSSLALAIALALSLATSATAHAGHDSPLQPRGHLRANRRAPARERRAAAAASSVLTEVPAVVTGAITISNTQAAPAGETASAVGAIKKAPKTLPGCSAVASSGESCSPVTGSCCDTGLTCYAGSCTNLCTSDTTESYCDADYPCNSGLGYVCTANRCRPPAGAVRVANGEKCDQGSDNTLFCIPGKGVCAEGTCQSCTQHS